MVSPPLKTHWLRILTRSVPVLKQPTQLYYQTRLDQTHSTSGPVWYTLPLSVHMWSWSGNKTINLSSAPLRVTEQRKRERRDLIFNTMRAQPRAHRLKKPSHLLIRLPMLSTILTHHRHTSSCQCPFDKHCCPVLNSADSRIGVEVAKLSDPKLDAVSVFALCLPYVVPNMTLAKREVSMC